MVLLWSHYSLFIFILFFKKWENEVRKKKPLVDSNKEKAVYKTRFQGPGISFPIRKVPHVR